MQDQFAAIERTPFTPQRIPEETLIVRIFAGPVQALVGSGFGTRLDGEIGRMRLHSYIYRMDGATYEGNGSQK